MKGMVFTNFLDMVEQSFGMDTVDTIIEESNVPSEGVYTSVGTYPHTEMVSLLVALEKNTGIAIPKLLTTYGEYLFAKLAQAYPVMLEGCESSRDLLLRLDGVVHVEVAKLYPDAQLPRFEATELQNGDLEMLYLSDRHLEDLAEGLLRGSFVHFKDSAEITRAEQEDGSVMFTVRYQNS